MTTTTMTAQLLTATGAPVAGVVVTARLIGGTDPGWSTDHTTAVVTAAVVKSDFSGTITVALTPQGLFAAAGTHYQLSGVGIDWAVVVPNPPAGGGSVLIRDNLVDPTTLAPTPAALPSYYLQRTERGVANGVAGLGADGLVPVTQLPVSSGAVASVNGHTGVVVLAAADVGADTAGAAGSAVGGHVAAVDPHGDRAFSVQRGNHSGTESADVLTDGVANKAFLATERTKLAGIGAGAAVTSVAAADATVTVGGTAAAPTVGVNAIPESKVTNLVADLAAKAADTAVVHLAGAETVAGVKTFTSAPVVPTPTAAGEAATKQYVDNKIAKAVRVYANGTGQVIANSAAPAILDINAIEFIDDAALYIVDAVANTVKPTSDGLYLVQWDVRFGATATGQRYSTLLVNGSQRAQTGLYTGSSTAEAHSSLAKVIRLLANDLVSISVYCDGGSSTLNTSSFIFCGFTIARLGA